MPSGQATARTFFPRRNRSLNTVLATAPAKAVGVVSYKTTSIP